MSIPAKVARVISEYEVALNAGAASGVAAQDIATVYRTIEIDDPDTGVTIGEVRRAAVRLEIVEVQENLSIGRTFEHVGDPTERFLNVLPRRVRVSDVRSAGGLVRIDVGDPVVIERPEKRPVAERSS